MNSKLLKAALLSLVLLLTPLMSAQAQGHGHGRGRGRVGTQHRRVQFNTPRRVRRGRNLTPGTPRRSVNLDGIAHSPEFNPNAKHSTWRGRSSSVGTRGRGHGKH